MLDRFGVLSGLALVATLAESQSCNTFYGNHSVRHIPTSTTTEYETTQITETYTDTITYTIEEASTTATESTTVHTTCGSVNQTFYVPVSTTTTVPGTTTTLTFTETPGDTTVTISTTSGFTYAADGPSTSCAASAKAKRNASRSPTPYPTQFPTEVDCTVTSTITETYTETDTYYDQITTTDFGTTTTDYSYITDGHTDGYNPTGCVDFYYYTSTTTDTITITANHASTETVTAPPVAIQTYYEACAAQNILTAYPGTDYAINAVTDDFYDQGWMGSSFYTNNPYDCCVECNKFPAQSSADASANATCVGTTWSDGTCTVRYGYEFDHSQFPYCPNAAQTFRSNLTYYTDGSTYKDLLAGFVVSNGPCGVWTGHCGD